MPGPGYKFKSKFPSEFQSILQKIEKNDGSYIVINIEDITITNEMLSQLQKVLQCNSIVGHIKWGKIEKSGIDKINIDNERLIKEIEDRIIKNNENYRPYPADFIHGLLSKHAYQDSEAGDKVEIKDEKIIPEQKEKWNSYLKGWEVFDVVNKFSNIGYYSALYIHYQQQHLVLAHRGTMPNEFQSIIVDINEIIAKVIGPATECAYNRVMNIIDLMKNKNFENFHFSVTGHSLGSYLSTLSTYFAYREGHNIKCVVFDSPGSGSMMDSLKSNINNVRTNQDISHLDIIHYLSMPNVINTLDKHVGRVYQVFPTKDKGDQFLSDELTNVKNNVLNIGHYHSLANILNEFKYNHETGETKNFMMISDWPSIKIPDLKINFSLEEKFKEALFKALILITPKFESWFCNKDYSTALVNIAGLLWFNIGKVDLNQYWGVIHHNKKQLQDGESPFTFSYKHHYKNMLVNDKKDILLKNKGQVDWYIKKLKQYQKFIDRDDTLSLITKKQLKSITNQIKIYPDQNGIEYIESAHHSINNIRYYIGRLLDITAPNIQTCIQNIKSQDHIIHVRDMMEKEFKSIYEKMFKEKKDIQAKFLYQYGKDYIKQECHQKAFELFKRAYVLYKNIQKENSDIAIAIKNNAILYLQKDFPFTPQTLERFQIEKIMERHIEEGYIQRGHIEEGLRIEDIRKVLQINIFNVIEDLVYKGQLDQVMQYIDKQYIKKSFEKLEDDDQNKKLGEELAKDDNNLEAALMLCFEAGNFGIMKNGGGNIDFISKFIELHPQLTITIAKECPQYFVDGSIIFSFLQNYFSKGGLLEQNCYLMKILHKSTIFIDLNGNEKPLPINLEQAKLWNDFGEIYNKMSKYTKAKQYFERAITQGHPVAMYNLGYMYSQENGFKQDYVEAKKWYEKAADQKYAPAINDLALFYSDKKWGFKLDGSYANKLWEQASQLGYSLSTYNLGLSYQIGTGTKVDLQKAFEYYNKALAQYNKEGLYIQFYPKYTKDAIIQEVQGLAHRGCKSAIEWYEQNVDKNDACTQWELGNMYIGGKNYVKAIEWYEKAAQQGYISVMQNLGKLYESDKGFIQDYVKAIEWYEKAAQQGHIPAMLRLSTLYESGGGVAQDYIKAFQYHQKRLSAVQKEFDLEEDEYYQKDREVEENKIIDCIYKLAQKNCRPAVEWYEQYSDKGNPYVQYRIGYMYDQGKGFDQDYIKAKEWYEKAAQQEYAPAMNDLALFYKGRGGLKLDASYANKLLEKASQLGYSLSTFNLGYSYRIGIGTKVDLQKALEYYNKAFVQYNKEGLYTQFYPEYTKNAIIQEVQKLAYKDCKSAVDWYKQHADKNDSDMQFKLGSIYYKEKDYHRAEIFFKKAYQGGCDEALYNLALTQAHLGLSYYNDKNYNKAYELWIQSGENAKKLSHDQKLLCDNEKFKFNLYQYFYDLGNKYNFGDDVEKIEKDYDKAYELYILTTKNEGAIDILYNLGLKYQKGEGVSKDLNKAFLLYQHAYNKQIPFTIFFDYKKESINNVYFIASQDREPEAEWYKQNHEQAIRLYEQNSDQGDVNVQDKLGYLYGMKNYLQTKSQDIIKDCYIKSIEWYEKAAQQGMTMAIRSIGIIYQRENNILKNYDKTFKYYKEALDKGHDKFQITNDIYDLAKKNYKSAAEWYEQNIDKNDTYAMDKLGSLYAEGNGVTQDYVKAREWYEKAAQQNDDYAQWQLGSLYAEGKGVAQDYVKAIEWYEKAAQQGYTFSMRSLASLYAKGKGVNKDLHKAFEYYKQAYDKGYYDKKYIIKCVAELVSEGCKEADKWLKENPSGDGIEEYDVPDIGYHPSWLKYYGKGVDEILELRIKGIKEMAMKDSDNNIASLPFIHMKTNDDTDTVFDAEFVMDLIKALEQNTKVLVPINLYDKHWVGMVFSQLEDNNIDVTYIDPENRSSPKSLEGNLRSAFNQHNVLFIQKFVGNPQKHSSCGPMVIEELIKCATGNSNNNGDNKCETNEIAIVPLHSMLLEQKLMEENGIKITKILPQKPYSSPLKVLPKILTNSEDTKYYTERDGGLYKLVMEHKFSVMHSKEMVLDQNQPSYLILDEKALAQLKHYTKTGILHPTAQAALENSAQITILHNIIDVHHTRTAIFNEQHYMDEKTMAQILHYMQGGQIFNTLGHAIVNNIVHFEEATYTINRQVEEQMHQMYGSQGLQEITPIVPQANIQIDEESTATTIDNDQQHYLILNLFTFIKNTLQFIES